MNKLDGNENPVKKLNSSSGKNRNKMAKKGSKHNFFE